MTAEQYVKSKYPKARVEVYKNRDKTRHWICWDCLYSPNGANRLGLSTKSKANAWVDAKNNIIERESKQVPTC